MKSKLEYIWLDGYKPTQSLRSKTMVRSNFTGKLEECPMWAFDGSSTEQAEGNDSDCLLKPVAIIPDPDRKNSFLVMTEVLNADGTPHVSNGRATIEEDDDDFWFGFEQEYVFWDIDLNNALGFPAAGYFPAPQGPYYCSVGAEYIVGRDIVEEHMDYCIDADINIEGINAEVMKGQWEYQVFAKGAKEAEDPSPEDIFTHDFAPTPIKMEQGIRKPQDGEEVVMVDCALHAVEELMRDNIECLLYGQDVGARLGGVFREAATLAQKFGDARVFNTPIQEAFIVGSTVGMAAVGLKPIVEVQFADYIWPGLNQLFTEVSRSCYLSNGKYPVGMILRVPIGAYGSGGPYHSSSVESVLTNIRGIKIAYPSNGADMKGLIKAAYHDPNPVVILEHKGLYWSKVPGTNKARVPEPDKDYVLPFGQANSVLQADDTKVESGESLCVITYGMGVHWALNAAKNFDGQIEILDLRTLFPLDEEAILECVKQHSKCIVLTEEPVNNSFARSISGFIQEHCFEYLDAPVRTVGSVNTPAIPLNSILESAYLPSAEKVSKAIQEVLEY